MPRRDRQLYVAWAIEGALVAFSVLSAASVGLFVMPVAVLLLLWLARRGASGPPMLGALPGAAVPVLAVAWLQRGPGDLDARPWLLAGLVLAAAGALGILAVRRRDERASEPTGRR